MSDPQDHEGFHLANQQDRQTVVAVVCTALAGAIIYATIALVFYGASPAIARKSGKQWDRSRVPNAFNFNEGET